MLGRLGADFGRLGASGGAPALAAWLLPDPAGNLITAPNGANDQGSSPAGDWTFVVSGAEFPTAWDLLNATAPNGQTEAWRYIEGGAGAGSKPWRAWVDKTKSNGTASQTFTGSIYAKRTASDDRNIGLVLQSPHDGDNYAEAYFDLSTGAISLTSAVDSATLLGTRCTSAGNGWWRCQIAATVAEANSTINFAFYCALTAGADFTARVVFTGNGTSGLYLWRGRLAEGNEIA